MNFDLPRTRSCSSTPPRRSLARSRRSRACARCGKTRSGIRRRCGSRWASSAGSASCSRSRSAASAARSPTRRSSSRSWGRRWCRSPTSRRWSSPARPSWPPATTRRRSAGSSRSWPATRRSRSPTPSATSRFDPLRVATRAQRTGKAYRLSGEKVFVLNGHAADAIVVSARTSGAVADREGVGAFVVDAGDARAHDAPHQDHGRPPRRDAHVRRRRGRERSPARRRGSAPRLRSRRRSTSAPLRPAPRGSASCRPCWP